MVGSTARGLALIPFPSLDGFQQCHGWLLVFWWFFFFAHVAASFHFFNSTSAEGLTDRCLAFSFQAAGTTVPAWAFFFTWNAHMV